MVVLLLGSGLLGSGCLVLVAWFEGFVRSGGGFLFSETLSHLSGECCLKEMTGLEVESSRGK